MTALRKQTSLDEDVIRSVYEDYKGCTWFMQMMMNELFALTPTGETCFKDMLAQDNDLSPVQFGLIPLVVPKGLVLPILRESHGRLY